MRKTEEAPPKRRGAIRKSKTRKCELCRREVPKVTKHHMIPKSRHNKRVKKKFGMACKERVALLCIPCHRQVHYLFSNARLEKEFSTLSKLRRHSDVVKWLKWIRKRPGDFVPSKGKRKR